LFTKLSLYIVDINNVIYALKLVMKEGANLDLIIANNVVKDIRIPVVDIVTELLVGNGYKHVESVERKMEEKRRRYPYGIKGFKGLMDTEYLISAKK